MAQCRILIVEDEFLSALGLKHILERLDYAAQITTTGEEAVELAEKENPDVVLMDINLDGEMDGIEAAEKISLELGIPVIFMTGYSDEGMMERAKQIKPAAILSKPLNIDIIKSAVESAIKKTASK
jgi:CheY-like chemotaxis protein